MTNKTGDNSFEKPTMDPEEEAAFVRNMLGFIERHGLGTPDFITAHIHALDSFGAAFVVHEGADDLKTDPSGDSGGRLACGVFVGGR